MNIDLFTFCSFDQQSGIARCLIGHSLYYVLWHLNQIKLLCLQFVYILSQKSAEKLEARELKKQQQHHRRQEIKNKNFYVQC